MYKSGDKYCADNYRGITLQNVACKVYADVLNRRLMKWMEINSKINDEQNGFRPERSCEDHIYLLKSIVNTSLAENKQVFGCYVDFHKAYDRIDRDSLWYKLLHSGIKGKIYHAIKSLYENVSCYVKLNNGYGFSNSFPVSIGLKQGCKLSTSLFNLYINDLCTEINKLQCGVKIGDQHVSILFYADDIVLLSNSATKLQDMLNCLSEWCKKWRMQINETKTKVIHFRKKSTRRSNYNFTCGDKVIALTSDYKYLGIWFNEFSDMSLAVKQIAKSATRVLGSIIAKFKALGGLSYVCFKKLYDSSVEPILRYAAGIWGTKEYKTLETVQNKAARFISGVTKTCPNLASRGDLGWSTWYCKQRLELVRLWLRLRSMDSSRLTYKIFKHNCSKAINSKLKNWECHVINVFKSDGLMYLVDIEDFDSNHIMKNCKEKLLDLDNASWHEALWDDQKLVNGNKL